ncbi:uncharacterized protein LOC135202295 [Macrobrachium nipponense]|uniref:uncharacterized protein LOC135202295 n=1 Tax=Macrobrachium nipponense TaxID=159736 RepID=UPI0030C842E9
MKKRIKKFLIVFVAICITGPLPYSLIHKENRSVSDSKILQEIQGGSKTEHKNYSINSRRRVEVDNYNSYTYSVIENYKPNDIENGANLVSYNNLTESVTQHVPNFPSHNGSETIYEKSNYIQTKDEKRANTSKTSRLDDDSPTSEKRRVKTVADIREEQDRRRKVVEEVCNAFGVQRDVPKTGSSLINNVHPGDKENYVDSVSMNHFHLARSTSSMTCLLNKVASTSLAVALLKADGRPVPEWNDSVSPHGAAAVLKPKTEAEFKFARKYFFKFLLVRHPFERLLSAYRDKVKRANHWSLKSFRKHIAETLKNNSKLKNAAEGVPKAHGDSLVRGGGEGTNLLEVGEEISVNNLASDSMGKDGDDQPRVVAPPTEESRVTESRRKTENGSPGASIHLGNTRDLNYTQEIHEGENPSSTVTRPIENSPTKTETSVWQPGTPQKVRTNDNTNLQTHHIKIPGENKATQTSGFKNNSGISPPAVPTFQDFLEYVLLPNVTDDPFSSHWSRYWETCSPCSLSYDVIAKLESAKEDLQMVYARMGLHGNSVAKERHNESPNAKSKETMLASYYSQLDPALIGGIYRRFALDFQLFEYDIMDVFRLAGHCTSPACSEMTDYL